MHHTLRLAVLFLAALVAGCAAGTSGPDRAALKTEAQCVASSNASAQSTSGPRSQTSIGMPNPRFGRSISDAGTWRYSTCRSAHFVS